jgi:hypothetical protein
MVQCKPEIIKQRELKPHFSGYDYRRTNEGGGVTDSQYFNPDGSVREYIYENRETKRTRKVSRPKQTVLPTNPNTSPKTVT